MCDYCKGYAPFLKSSENLSLKGDFFPGVDMYLDGDELQLSISPDTYEPSYMEAYVKIRFCPMCGEELKVVGKDV